MFCFILKKQEVKFLLSHLILKYYDFVYFYIMSILYSDFFINLKEKKLTIIYFFIISDFNCDLIIIFFYNYVF